MDYKKFAMALMDMDVLERVASNEDHSITLLHENLDSLGEFLVLWIDNTCRVFNVSARPHHYEMLCDALRLTECGIAGEVWPAECITVEEDF